MFVSGGTRGKPKSHRANPHPFRGYNQKQRSRSESITEALIDRLVRFETFKGPQIQPQYPLGSIAGVRFLLVRGTHKGG